jgi:hypothetical protein
VASCEATRYPHGDRVAKVARASVEDTCKQSYFEVLTKNFSRCSRQKPVDLHQGGPLRAGAYSQSPRKGRAVLTEPYVIDKLLNWGKERGQNPKIPDTSAIMSPVAHSLNKSQIEAVAAYVSTLK